MTSIKLPLFAAECRAPAHDRTVSDAHRSGWNHGLGKISEKCSSDWNFYPTRSAFVICLLFVCACLPAKATTYYVATDGSDAKDGKSLSTAFRTIGRAAEEMIAGDTCLIRGGTYREILRPTTSGTSNAPIVFASYKHEAVTITGADTIQGWTRHSGDIYQAPMPWDLGMGFNQIFVDGEIMSQARYPKSGVGDSLMMPSLLDVTVGKDSVSSKELNQTDGFWTGAYVVGGVNYSWAWQWGKVTESSSNGILKIEQGSKPLLIPDIGDMTWFTGQGRMSLFGKLAFLTAEKEWEREDGVLYLWAPSGDNPGKHIVEAKRRAWCVDFDGKDFVVVDGISLHGGTVRMNGNHGVLRNCTATYLSHFTIFPWLPYDGGAGAADGNQGIYVQGSDNVVSGCTISYSAGSAVVISGTRNLLLRCLIHDIDYSGTYSAPVVLSGTKARVWFNTIYNAGRDIILMGGDGHDIRYNDLSHPGMLCKDLGVIYVGSSGDLGSRISYNWIHDNPIAKLGVGPGIYLENYSRNTQVDHNVVWNCLGDAGIRINGPKAGVTVYNNTLFACDEIGSHTYNCWPNNNPEPAFWVENVYKYEVANNLYLAGDPALQLTDVAQRDFRPLPKSQAIGAGLVIPGITDSYTGAAPDKGAYQASGLRWMAGVDGVAAEKLMVSTAGGASSITTNSAFLNVRVSLSYDQPTHVSVFWGMLDGDCDEKAWSHTASFDMSTDGHCNTKALDLKPDTTYFYRCHAVNASGETWSTTSVFRTIEEPRKPLTQ